MKKKKKNLTCWL